MKIIKHSTHEHVTADNGVEYLRWDDYLQPGKVFWRRGNDAFPLNNHSVEVRELNRQYEKEMKQ